MAAENSMPAKSPPASHFTPIQSKQGNFQPPGLFNIPVIDASLPNGSLLRGAIHEFVPASYPDFAAAFGFMACLLHKLRDTETAPVIWCGFGDRTDFPHTPYPHGLAALGPAPDNFLHVEVKREKDMLWVIEEGLSSPTGPLIGAIYTSSEKLYDFTASRRLSVRAARYGGTLLLLRHYMASHPMASGSTAAVTRWVISSRPSSPVQHNNAKVPAVGPPRWHVTLARCKQGHPGNWQMEWDHETLSFNLVTPLADRTSVSGKSAIQ
ncbi:ImuA family protein [Sneathiella sp.]|uniref:ImuA family protein n=1 Tax=Sneathiella sp. TaxID=1964365 RepID=UPI003563BAA2